MLKTISEEYLPKQIKIVKDDPEEDGECAYPTFSWNTSRGRLFETYSKLKFLSNNRPM